LRARAEFIYEHAILRLAGNGFVKDRWSEVSLGDDLVTAGVSGVAALVGAWIGARATRRASTEAFDRAAERDSQAWRLALHRECLQNIDLSKELSEQGLWSFQTRVLRDCPSHAGAFSATVLQHVIWAVTADEQLEAVLNSMRESSDPVSAQSREAEMTGHRSRTIQEIIVIEQELRTCVPKLNER
jgi:hypothetical protein